MIHNEARSGKPEPRPPLRRIPSGVTFSDSEYIGEGTHSVVYKVTARKDQKEYTRCLKIFQKGWDTPYILETAAYAYLRTARVEEFIPKFYGYDLRTPSQWGLDRIMGEEDGEFYGIVVEWIEGGEQLSERNITLELVVNFICGLIKIHNAGVFHNDPSEQNMLVVPSTKRSVWIDFSCALIGSQRYHQGEMEGVAGFAIGMVFPVRLDVC